jgi:hypothetical protein
VAVERRRRKLGEINMTATTEGRLLASTAAVALGANRPIWVRPKEAAKLGGFGLTRCYELMNNGTLRTIKLGGMRLVSVASIENLGQ